MFNALNKTAILAATAFALSIGAVGNASALSIELAPGVQHQQKCFDKPVKVTKYVQVVRYNKWVTVPKTVIVTKTVCKDYYIKVPAHHARSDHKPGWSKASPVHHTPSYGY